MSDGIVQLRTELAGSFLGRLFARAGLDDASAETMAGALVAADVQGLPSHGLMQAPMYLKRLQLGSVSRASRGEIIVDSDAIAVIDAKGVFGHLVGDQAMTLAVTRAKRFGAGVVAVRDAFHFGAAGRYSSQAAASGCIGMAVCNTRPLMPAPGGSTAVVGNNPVAIGLPVGAQPNFLLDMALSEVALGKIRLASVEGRKIPSDWAVDVAGQATTDPDAALAGMLLPAGGAKGFGLALAIDLMASLLSGGPAGHEIGPMYGDLSIPFRCSLLFLAIDIAHFGEVSDFEARAAASLARIRAGDSVDGRALRTPGANRRVEGAFLQIGRETILALNRIASDLHVTEVLPL